MKLAILMDDPQGCNPKKDSTIAMIKAANALQWQCAYFTLADLHCCNGSAYADLRTIRYLSDNSPDWADISDKQTRDLSNYDLLLMRKDPPFNLEYIYATYALELAASKGVLVANNPQSLRDANEKFYTLNFPECCPETIVTRDMQRLRNFWEQHKSVVFKPLEGMGGSSVFLVDEHGKNLSVILELLSDRGQVSVMAQKYIADIVTSGDKRVLVVHGKPVDFGLARIPKKGELRGNLAAGARGEVVPLTKRDYWIVERLAPTLVKKGLYFVGLDIIGGYLTEINVTSPTCIREIEQETGLDIAGDFLQGLAQLRASGS